MASYFKKNLSVTRLTSGKLPSLPFLKLKEAVLDKKYELSIVFAGTNLSQKFNRKYRGKNKPANILSFPLSKTEGEIIISLAQARKEAPRFGMSYMSHLGSLLIHGMLHLKGYKHGKKMQMKETKLNKRFGFET